MALSCSFPWLSPRALRNPGLLCFWMGLEAPEDSRMARDGHPRPTWGLVNAGFRAGAGGQIWQNKKPRPIGRGSPGFVILFYSAAAAGASCFSAFSTGAAGASWLL